MDEFSRLAFLEWEAKRSSRRRGFWAHAVVWGALNTMLFVIWLVTGADFPWFVFPLLGTALPLASHAATVFVLRRPDDVIYQREARRRRIER